MIINTIVNIVIRDDVISTNNFYICKLSDLENLKKVLKQSIVYSQIRNAYAVERLMVNMALNVGLIKKIYYTTHSGHLGYRLGILKTIKTKHVSFRIDNYPNSTHQYIDVVLSTKLTFASCVIAESVIHKGQTTRQYAVCSLNSNDKFIEKPKLTEEHYGLAKLITNNVTYDSISMGKLKL